MQSQIIFHHPWLKDSVLYVLFSNWFQQRKEDYDRQAADCLPLIRDDAKVAPHCYASENTIFQDLLTKSVVFNTPPSGLVYSQGKWHGKAL